MSEKKKRTIEYILAAAGLISLTAVYVLSYHSYSVKSAVVIQAALCAFMVAAGGFFCGKHDIVSIAGRTFFYAAVVPLLNFSWITTFMYIKSFEQDYMALIASGMQNLGRILVPVTVVLAAALALKIKSGSKLLLKKEIVVLCLCLLLFAGCMILPRFYLVWWYLIGCGLYLICCSFWERFLEDDRHGFVFRVTAFGILFVRAAYLIAYKSFIYTLAS